MSSCNPIIFEIIAKPPMVMGLVLKALIPMGGFFALYICFFLAAQALKGYWGIGLPLELLNGFGWLLPPPLSFVFLKLRSIPMKWIMIFEALFVVILLALPTVIFHGFLGWGLTGVILYSGLRVLLEEDHFSLNVFESHFQTPPQNSNLNLNPKERRYV